MNFDFFTGVMLSAIITSALGLPLFMPNSVFEFSNALILCFINFATLVLPLALTYGNYKKSRDVFSPFFVADVAFLALYMLFNLPTISSQITLEKRNFVDFNTDIMQSAIDGYLIVFVGWLFFIAARMFGPLFKMGGTVKISASTGTFLVVGFGFLIVGIAGNAISLGGIQAYLQKMVTFYSIDQRYLDSMTYGGTPLKMAMRFLPVALIILGYGWCLWHKVSVSYFLKTMVVISIANLFLNCAGGGRGAMLKVALWSTIAFHHHVRKISLRLLITVFVVMITFATIMGAYRVSQFYGTNLIFDKEKILFLLEHTCVYYFSNFMGVMVLVREVADSGTTGGSTAFAGLTGLFGGETPINTQTEMTYRLTGSYTGGTQARYGLPGELYFNFGWAGLAIGLFLVGLVVNQFSRLHVKFRGEKSVLALLVVIYAVESVFFLVAGRMSQMPAYFLLFSWPFFASFLAFRNIKC